MSLLLLCGGVSIFVCAAVTVPLVTDELEAREARQRTHTFQPTAAAHFAEEYQYILGITDDALLYQENSGGYLAQGDNRYEPITCLYGMARQVRGTERSYVEVSEAYADALLSRGYIRWDDRESTFVTETLYIRFYELEPETYRRELDGFSKYYKIDMEYREPVCRWWHEAFIP